MDYQTPLEIVTDYSSVERRLRWWAAEVKRLGLAPRWGVYQRKFWDNGRTSRYGIYVARND